MSFLLSRAARAFQRSPATTSVVFAVASYSSSHFFLRTPSPTAPREVPTPIVVLSSKAWDAASADGMQGYAAMLAERGYTVLDVDMEPPMDTSDPEQLLTHFESEIVRHVRLSMIPFPPVIMARGAGTQIAQRYVSSHPASGMALIDPPSKDLEHFNFEPTFPIAIVSSASHILELTQNGHRLASDKRVHKIEVSGSEVLNKIVIWMDEIGV